MCVRSLQGVTLLIRKHSSSGRLEDVPLATGSEEKAGWSVGEGCRLSLPPQTFLSFVQ